MKSSWLSRQSLKFRFTMLLVIIMLILGAVMVFVIFQMYNTRIQEEYENKGSVAARTAASMLDGETVDRYLDTLEKDESYRRTLQHFKVMQKENDLTYIYITRIADGRITYVFDTDEEETQELGQFIDWVDDWGDDYNEYYAALSRGERVEPIATEEGDWEYLLTIWEPIFRADGSVAAYACVDISMQQILWERAQALISLSLTILLIIIVFILIYRFAINKSVISPIHALADEVSAYMPTISAVDGEETEDSEAKSRPESSALRSGNELDALKIAVTEMKSRISTTMADLKHAEERVTIMLDATPLCCLLWDSNISSIDCNDASLKLYGFNSKHEYLNRFFELSPEYQPDGQRSDEKAVTCVKKAFEEGSYMFDWTHQMLDGTPIPAEITLVRISYKDDYLVAWYTRDLRQIKNMEKNILRLEVEADKIFYDPLTNIYNRRFFDENLSRAIKSLSRSGSVLSLMMIDIDFFKRFNDTYGHKEGDNCLKIVAETLKKSTMRPDDFVARYGGEEFSVVLPNTDEDGARLVAEKLLESIRECAIPHKKSDAANCVTISIGVTTSKVDHLQTGDDYIKRADEALYISKHTGRNRYTFQNL